MNHMHVTLSMLEVWLTDHCNVTQGSQALLQFPLRQLKNKTHRKRDEGSLVKQTRRRYDRQNKKQKQQKKMNLPKSKSWPWSMEPVQPRGKPARGGHWPSGLSTDVIVASKLNSSWGFVCVLCKATARNLSSLLTCELVVQQMKWSSYLEFTWRVCWFTRNSTWFQIKHINSAVELKSKVLLLQSIIKRFYLYTIET